MDKTQQMTKEQFRKCLDESERLMKEDEKLNEAYRKFQSVLCSDFAPNGITIGSVQIFIDSIRFFFGDDLLEDIEYYTYEVPDMDECYCWDKNKKKYNAKDKDQYTDFVFSSRTS